MQTKLFNDEAEKSLLGCLLSSTVPEMYEDIFSQLTAEDFFCTEYQQIFFAVQTLWIKGKDIDLVTVNETVDRIKKKNDKTNYTQMLFE